MNENLRKAAPYISILGLVVLAASLFLSTTANQSPKWLIPTLATVGVVMLLAWPVFAYQDFREAAGGRQARHGANALVLALSVIGILVVLNYLGHLFYWRWDLTENKQFSVSRATIQILEDLQTPVTLTSTLNRATDRQQIDDLKRLMEEYQKHTTQITYENIDPVDDPVKLAALAQSVDQQPQALGRTLVAQSGGRHDVGYAFDEQAVTESLVKATRDRDLNVWFTTGHQERALDTDYSQVRQVLEQQGYKVETKNLGILTETLKADNVQAVVVAGPQQPFRPEETKMLSDYVDEGGSVMLLMDPSLENVDLGLEPLLQPWGITADNDAVVDQARSLGGDMLQMVVPSGDLRFHSITRDLQSLNSLVALPVSRSFEVAEGGAKGEVTTLAESSPASWGEKNIEALKNGQAAQDPDDRSGPVALAVAGDGGENGGRIVVFGTSLFAMTDYVQRLMGSLNLALFSNAMNWLTQEEDLITIPPTQPNQHPLKPVESPTRLLLFTALLMPLAVLLVGAYFWWSRR